MRLLIILVLILLTTSCEPRLENNVRAQLSARVLTASNIPIPDVEVTAFNENFINIDPYSLAKFSAPEQDFILGTGLTDENGVVSYVMLLNNNSGTRVALLADGYPETIIDLADSNYKEDLEYVLEDIVLKKSSEIILEMVNTSGASNSFNVDFIYESSFCSQFNEQGISEDFDCNFFNRLSVDTTEMVNEFEFFNAVYPGSLLVRYTDVQGNPVEQTFIISNPNENYVINY